MSNEQNRESEGSFYHSLSEIQTEFSNSQLENRRGEFVGIDPNAVTALAVTGVAVAGAAVALGTAAVAVGATASRLNEQRKGGQVIDLRENTPKFYRTKDVVYGYVVILASDGTVTAEVKEVQDMYGQAIDALKCILPYLTNGVEEVAEALKTTLNDIAEVKSNKTSG